jgi:phosphatidyl-myo-inositol alpha-mannosyltransferase
MPDTPPPALPALRVALVCPYSLSRPGGVQGQVTGLARALTQRGHRVTVFAPIDDPADAPEGIDLVVAGHSVPLPANGSRAPVSISPRAAAHAVAALRRGGYDVVHVHEPFSPGLPYALLLARGVPPLVATFHRSGGSFFYSVLRPLARRRADHRFAARCAVSEAARQTADHAVGGEYTVLFNGVEIERFRDADPWPTEGPTVLFLGRHEERKGLRILLEAFAILAGIDRLTRRRRSSRGGRDAAVRRGLATEAPVAEGGTAPILWIAGNGPETEWLQRLHPESTQIRWLGILNEEEKVRRLAAADVLCAPSLGGESFGMVLLEAMAARTLVVASDIDGYRDAVGEDAVLVPPGEPAALADALASALVPSPGPDAGEAGGRPDPRADRLAAGSARAERWSMSDLAERYEAIYGDVSVPDPA